MKSGMIFRAALHVALLAMVFTVASSSPQYSANYLKGMVSLSNRPVRSVWVIASQGGYEKGRSLTGDDGKYYIGKLSDGSYDILVLRGKEQIYKGQVQLPSRSDFNIVISAPRR